ncbi:MAG: serine hydrolase [Bacteroidetes bacterium]|nr:serine hydrolase [Bacteroidota bacterium]
MKKSLLVLLAIIAINPAFSQTKEEKLDDVLSTYARLNRFNGSALIYHKGQVLLHRGYGYSQAADKRKNYSATIFQIGSVTKQFTATIILKLQEQGKLKLSDNLSVYFPDYPKGDSITLYHLLTHTSGIYNYTDDESFMQSGLEKGQTKEAMMALFKNKPLEFTPGSQMKYCNSGYLLLGYIIEKITKRSYESVVRERIFTPLQMTESGFDFKNLHHAQKATGYTAISDNNTKTAMTVDSTISFSGGAMYSTTTDLLKWHLGLQNNKIISNSSKAKAFTPNKNSFGFGWVIDSFDQKKAVFHNGSIPGFTSNIYRIEKDNTCIILLNNMANPDIDTITKALLSVLYDKPFRLPEIRQEITMGTGLMKTYSGFYSFNPDFIMHIYTTENHLYAQRVGDVDKFEIFLYEKNKFFLKAFEATLLFTENNTGNIDTLTLIQGGRNMKAIRTGENNGQLFNEVLKMDSLFGDAFNTRDIDKLKSLFSPELSFYHDKTGLTRFSENIRLFTDNFNSDKKMRRELVRESLDVYPVPGFGAIETGIHTFYVTEPGQAERLDSRPKFVHVWKKSGDKWELINVISYDH